MATSDYISGWFFSAEFKRENVVDWLLWALFSATRDTCLVEWEEEIEEYLSMIEVILDRKLAPGYNAGARCMRPTLDSVSMLHRPLIWYLVSHHPSVMNLKDLRLFRLWVWWIYFHRSDFGARDSNIMMTATA